jgi:hypothetical protein
MMGRENTDKKLTNRECFRRLMTMPSIDATADAENANGILINSAPEAASQAALCDTTPEAEPQTTLNDTAHVNNTAHIDYTAPVSDAAHKDDFEHIDDGSGDYYIDRLPAIEWASWWDKTLKHWEQNGLPKNLDTQELYNYFQLDSNTQFWFSHKTHDCPEDTSHGSGIIENMEDYERIRPYILPEDAVEKMSEQIKQTLPRYEKGETIVWYTLEGFFWWPRVLLGIENHLYAFYDQPELYHRICEDLLQWQIRVVDTFAGIMKADFMTLAEDMSYNLGPMLSEDLYNEFIKPYYQRLIPEIKKHGTKVFIDSDGDITKAVPWFISSGIEGVLPLERQAGVDLAKLRRDWPELLMIGGFDKMCMFEGKKAIAAEFQRLQPVIEQGRYLPSMDHQTPPGVALEDYHFYVDLL